MKFYAYGHRNILATHKSTLEFTKDRELTKKRDCIIGVSSDFSLAELKQFIKNLKKKKIKIIVRADGFKEEINADINPYFDDDTEIVIRKSNFISKRTFAINANKAAVDLKRELISRLKENKKYIVGIFGV